jgi:hypothetical protein
MHGRRRFGRGLSRRLTLIRHVASPSGNVLLDFALES